MCAGEAESDSSFARGRKETGWYRPVTARLLDNATLAQLPDGARIVVTWSGGNGPHRYILRRDQFGALFAETDFAHGNTRHRLDVVGRHPLTQVWVDEEHRGSQ